MLSRREWLGMSLGAGATLALSPELLRALQTPQKSGAKAPQSSGGKLIHRGIPSTGEMLPVIGLGFADHASCADPAALKEVLKTFVDNGGRVFDTMQTSGEPTEQFHATVAKELGVQSKLFLGLKGFSGRGGSMSDPAIAKAQIESLLESFKVQKLDLVQLPVAADPEYWAVVKEAKKAGRVRYVGLTTTSFAPFPRVEAVMRSGSIDFVAVNYTIDDRRAEEKILPLAQELDIAVLGYFPFGGANGVSCTGGKGIFARIGSTPLPEWAAEFDAKTWAQFCLKYLISHPAITTVRVGTTKVHHMLDDIGGGIGRLPNEATRKRMAELIDALPMVLPPQLVERYVGEYKAASGRTATFRRDESQLFVKSGTDPEVALVARSSTRFVDPKGSAFEFQLTGQGPATKVTGVVLEQGGEKLLLERK
jgi:aryl-alcohol dehydrogenase-like predicted oxidoreductase